MSRCSRQSAHTQAKQVQPLFGQLRAVLDAIREAVQPPSQQVAPTMPAPNQSRVDLDATQETNGVQGAPAASGLAHEQQKAGTPATRTSEPGGSRLGRHRGASGSRTPRRDVSPTLECPEPGKAGHASRADAQQKS